MSNSRQGEEDEWTNDQRNRRAGQRGNGFYENWRSFKGSATREMRVTKTSRGLEWNMVAGAAGLVAPYFAASDTRTTGTEKKQRDFLSAVDAPAGAKETCQDRSP